MKNKLQYLLAMAAAFSVTVFIVSCEKDAVTKQTPDITPVASASFTEEFDKVGDLSAKGWVIKNNSTTTGGSAWRQGRYETSTKFPVDFIGFPAYSASNAPTDFVSCDVSAIGLTGDISAWLISPKMTIKNGDVISFYTRALDDANFLLLLSDRMQVRANFSGDGSVDIGTTAASVGKFTNLLLDINPGELENYPSGYPEAWQKYTITVSGLTTPVSNARFAFRYMRKEGGLNDAVSAGLVGIDQLSFQSK
jgi:hypothetical protein